MKEEEMEIRKLNAEKTDAVYAFYRALDLVRERLSRQEVLSIAAPVERLCALLSEIVSPPSRRFP